MLGVRRELPQKPLTRPGQVDWFPLLLAVLLVVLSLDYHLWQPF